VLVGKKVIVFIGRNSNSTELRKIGVITELKYSGVLLNLSSLSQ